MSISTHVLLNAEGLPATGLEVKLEREVEEAWEVIDSCRTDDDGRIRFAPPQGGVNPGRYRLSFDTVGYFESRGIECFFEQATFVFRIQLEKNHVPLLLTPFSLSTYRGS